MNAEEYPARQERAATPQLDVPPASVGVETPAVHPQSEEPGVYTASFQYGQATFVLECREPAGLTVWVIPQQPSTAPASC